MLFFLFLDPDDGLITTAEGERRKIVIRRATVLIGKNLPLSLSLSLSPLSLIGQFSLVNCCGMRNWTFFTILAVHRFWGFSRVKRLFAFCYRANSKQRAWRRGQRKAFSWVAGMSVIHLPARTHAVNHAWTRVDITSRSRTGHGIDFLQSKQLQWPIITNVNNTMNQWELKANTRNRRQARENKRVWPSRDWFWFCIRLVEKVARVFRTNQSVVK